MATMLHIAVENEEFPFKKWKPSQGVALFGKTTYATRTKGPFLSARKKTAQKPPSRL